MREKVNARRLTSSLSQKPIAKDVASAKKLIETYEKEYKPKGLIWRVAEVRSRLFIPHILRSSFCLA